jgi:zinc transport system permease protein
MTEFLTFPFLQRALIAGIMVGFLASYYGVFIVQRRMSFLGSGLGHAAFGGVALGLLLNVQPLWIAIPFTVIVSLSISYLKEKTKLAADTAIGILFSLSVALGIIFLSFKDGFSVDAFNYMFGTILGVSESDLYVTGVLIIITIASFFIYWHKWAYSSFDNELARADRIKVVRGDYVLSVLIAVTIVVSVKVVGIVLIASFLVIPAAAARLISGSFFRMTIFSVIIGISSSVFGLFLSFVLDKPSGAVIILLQSLLFFIAAVIGRFRKS